MEKVGTAQDRWEASVQEPKRMLRTADSVGAPSPENGAHNLPKTSYRRLRTVRTMLNAISSACS
jgi:hypothetical protein